MHQLMWHIDGMLHLVHACIQCPANADRYFHIPRLHARRDLSQPCPEYISQAVVLRCCSQSGSCMCHRTVRCSSGTTANASICWFCTICNTKQVMPGQCVALQLGFSLQVAFDSTCAGAGAVASHITVQNIHCSRSPQVTNAAFAMHQNQGVKLYMLPGQSKTCL